MTSHDIIKCFKQNNNKYFTCEPISELPSSISTVHSSLKEKYSKYHVAENNVCNKKETNKSVKGDK